MKHEGAKWMYKEVCKVLLQYLFLPNDTKATAKRYLRTLKNVHAYIPKMGYVVLGLAMLC